MAAFYLGASTGLQSEPHLGNDEAVICPTIGITKILGYQHVLSILPADENIVQQMPAPQSRVHSRGLLPRRKSEEGVGQQETVFHTRAQKKVVVIVTAIETLGTKYSLPGSVRMEKFNHISAVTTPTAYPNESWEVAQMPPGVFQVDTVADKVEQLTLLSNPRIEGFRIPPTDRRRQEALRPDPEFRERLSSSTN
ncbi:unnamed protein product [Schistocephalus solidus]|uniref:Uncharacterized protein n=1 Tax=Schistocephalus solidus TaxID=70667 RepID=A0A183SVS1_SCHSO|nr:unnamed protein product [Schistocephalus solidus]